MVRTRINLDVKLVEYIIVVLAVIEVSVAEVEPVVCTSSVWTPSSMITGDAEVVILKPEVPAISKVELLSEALPTVIMVFVVVVSRPLDDAIAVALKVASASALEIIGSCLGATFFFYRTQKRGSCQRLHPRSGLWR